MLEDLLETWRAHNAIHLNLLDHLPGGGLDALSLPTGMTVGQQLAHMHTVRVRWTEESEPALTKDSKKFQRDEHPSREVLQQALKHSGEVIHELIKRRHQTGVNGFPGSVTSFVGYLISHESHHRGQIVLALEHSGRPLAQEQKLALWQGWWAREVGKRSE